MQINLVGSGEPVSQQSAEGCKSPAVDLVVRLQSTPVEISFAS
ncbi:hypothetical protein [Candidatus Coxiella mudrowiae]|nr:hypothetical protein [Candidatus Coxiella mudrowiae]